MAHCHQAYPGWDKRPDAASIPHNRGAEEASRSKISGEWALARVTSPRPLGVNGP